MWACLQGGCAEGLVLSTTSSIGGSEGGFELDEDAASAAAAK